MNNTNPLRFVTDDNLGYTTHVGGLVPIDADSSRFLTRWRQAWMTLTIEGTFSFLADCQWSYIPDPTHASSFVVFWDLDIRPYLEEQ